METPATPDASSSVPPSFDAPVDAGDGPPLNLGQRLIAVYARPTAAWTGLRRQVQWWFPMLIIALVAAGFAAALHHRALVPMMVDTWREQVANGNMTADQVDRMEAFFSGPTGMTITIAQQFLILPIVLFVTALVVWFGTGFILGRAMTYRLALEVTCWSGLIMIPAQLLTGVIAWTRETMKGVHVGFGLLLPDTDTPSRIGIFLGAVLDALGPLSVWYVVVLVIGAAALSGAPRRQAAWVLGGLYIVLVLLFAGLGAMLTPVSS